MSRRASRQPTGIMADDWIYCRHVYHFKAGAGKFIKRVLSRWRRHHGQRELRNVELRERQA